MTSMSVKKMFQNIASFFKPVPVRNNVLVNGEDSEGIEIPRRSLDPHSAMAKYTAYPVDYVLIGIDHFEGKDYVFYRFFDPQTKKEFHLSKPLVDILLYKKSI